MKKLKIIALCCFSILTCFIFLGCGNNQSKISDKIDHSLNNLSSILKGTDNIMSTELVISEIMDENEVALLTSIPNSNKQIVKYDNSKTGYNGATFTSANVYQGRYINTNDNFQYNSLTSYVVKLEQLHDIASDTITANNNAKYLKANLNSKISAVKSINSQINNGTIELNNQQFDAIEDLLTNLNINANRINFSKNELTNEVKAVKNLKNNYANNIEQLNSKYTKLLNCLDTRCSYYSNCLGCLDGIYNCILNGTASIEDLLKYYTTQNNTENGACTDENCNYCDENGNCYDENGDDCNMNQEGINQTMSNYYPNHPQNNYPYNMYDMYNNGYARYWGNNYYQRNINSFGGPRNINSFRENYRRNNINSYKDLNSNVDTYKKSNNKNEQLNDFNSNDPHKILPTNLDKNPINTNIQNNEITNKSSYEYKELYYNSNPNSPEKNKGFFRVYKVEDGELVVDELKEINLDEEIKTENPNEEIKTENQNPEKKILKTE